MNATEWSEKIKIAIILGTTKGLKTTRVGLGFNNWSVQHPDESKKRFTSVSKMITYLENYNEG